MRALLTAAALLLFSVSSYAQTNEQGVAQPSPTPFTKKEREARAKAEREREKQVKKQFEAEEKERLKRPAEIRINSPADRVGPILVRYMNDRGYQIADEGKYRLVFQREVTGFRAGMATAMAGGDSPPLWTVSYTITELSGVTVITADMAVIMRRRFGTPRRTDMNKHRQSRQDLEALLEAVKIEAESR